MKHRKLYKKIKKTKRIKSMNGKSVFMENFIKKKFLQKLDKVVILYIMSIYNIVKGGGA